MRVESPGVVILLMRPIAAVGDAILVIENELNRGGTPKPLAVASNTILTACVPAESDAENGTIVAYVLLNFRPVVFGNKSVPDLFTPSTSTWNLPPVCPLMTRNAK